MSDRKSVADPSWSRRRKIIGVMGSGVEAHADLATVAGHTIARLGYHLLTGGGGGVMEAVSRAFYETSPREGQVVGVIRAQSDAHFSVENGRRNFSPRRVNDFVEIPVFTHLPDSSGEPTSRNHINVLTADVVLVLPGGSGTLSELELSVEYDWAPLMLFLGGLHVGGLSAGELVRDKAPGAIVIDSASSLESTLRSALDCA